MSDLTIYETGMRNPDGGYSKFMESPDEKAVDDHIDIMKDCRPEGFEIMRYKKTYRLISTIPHIIDWS